uniref:Uncharacterized protein n=1 Tax=Rhizophora mucronata TaxID=61149 RepID=A0A2P2MT39_RHIMU
MFFHSPINCRLFDLHSFVKILTATNGASGRCCQRVQKPFQREFSTSVKIISCRGNTSVDFC